MGRAFTGHPIGDIGWQPPRLVDTMAIDDFNYKFVDSFICRRTRPNLPLGNFYRDRVLDHPFALFLLQTVVVVFVTRIVRFLLKPFKQPRIVSEVIGGIIVGPSVLGRNRMFADNVFPDNGKFLVKHVGFIGFMFFLFVSGVKSDLTQIKRTGRKHFCIALIGVLIPMAAVLTVGFILRPFMDKHLAKGYAIGAIAASLSITAFPVIIPILKELNLLNSEIGRMAVWTSLVTDAIGMNVVVAFDAAFQGQKGANAAALYLISLLVFVPLLLVPVRLAMLWVVRKTPDGEPVKQVYVVAIWLGSMVMGFITDMFGLALNGPLWLGLLVPDGPPLGATLVEKCEMIVMEIFMPLSFATVGLNTDVFNMITVGWSSLSPLFAMVIVGHMTKLGTIFMAAIHFEIPVRDSLAFSLMMNLRGQVEFLIFLRWIDQKKILVTSDFTMMVLITTAVTALAAPLITMLYDPTRPYRMNQRRNIQHSPLETELRMVVSIDDEASVAGLINLLELSHPTTSSPISVHALRLIELAGRAQPLFINHEKQNDIFKCADDDSVHNCLKMYRKIKGDNVRLQTYTSISPKRTMYQDICELALTNDANIIILPCYIGPRLDHVAGTELVRHRQNSLTSEVIAHAPCSVGVLVEKFDFRNQRLALNCRPLIRHFILLFFGGADAREALVFADRMCMNPNVCLAVIRFLSHNDKGDEVKEKKLDDGVVSWFWVKNEGNDQVVYKEVVVRNGAETVAVIRDLNDNETYDLWIMGREQGINPVLLDGLSMWGGENDELGIIGEYVASSDFNATASVLVVQQQILRG